MPKQFTSERLNKALEEFEEKLAKGDALQDQPHDGGLATQGTNIQSKADAKKAVEKALAAQGMSKATADTLLKMLSASDMESGEGEDEPPEASSPMDSEDEDENDAMDKSKKAKKSTSQDLRKSLIDADSRNEEVLDIAPFLGDFVGKFDQMSKATNSRVDGLAKALTDNQKMSSDFNVRLAKAMELLFDNVSTRFDLLQKKVEDIAAQPVPNASRGLVRKSDIQQPQFNGGPAMRDDVNNLQNNVDVSALQRIDYLKVTSTLADYAIKGFCDPLEVIKFENSRGDFTQLPTKVLQQLTQDLCPTA